MEHHGDVGKPREVVAPEIQLEQAERSTAPRGLEIAALESRLVVLGEAVDARDPHAFGQQPFREVRADEAGCARDDVSQRLLTIPYSFAYPTR